jgi:tetratricopeptide (TPR) repeat protein
MRRNVDRWRRRAALLAALLAAAAARPALAGPVKSFETPTAKIEEIEKAGAALQKGQIDEAYKLLQEAVKKKPDLPPARLMLARLFLASKEGQQHGRTLFEQAAAENPDHPEVYLTNGSQALEAGRFTDTILNCERAIALTSAARWTAEQRKTYLAQARAGLAAAYERRQDWAGARTHLAAWLEDDPKNGQLRRRLAQALFFLDKADDAYSELQQAVKDDSTLDSPNITMGRLWTMKGDAKKAREWLEKATKADPASPRVHLAYADWLLQQNEIEQAKIHADTAAKIKADDPEVLKIQGLTARIQEDFAKAEQTFRRVLADAPADFFATNHLALVLADQSDKEQRSRAVQYAEMNARANQGTPEAFATLGYVYYRVGNLEGALQALQPFLTGRQPASSDAAYYLALVLNDRDKADEAKKILKAALDAKGLFVYRRKAQALYDKLDKKEPVKTSSSK